jgi:hypothetical protein
MNFERPGILERLRRSWGRSMNRRKPINDTADLNLAKLQLNVANITSENPAKSLCKSSALLTRRLHLLGIDSEYVRNAEPDLYTDLARACASCRVFRQCARDLACGDVQSGMSTYCPNGPSIDLFTLGLTKPAPVAGTPALQRAS